MLPEFPHGLPCKAGWLYCLTRCGRHSARPGKGEASLMINIDASPPDKLTKVKIDTHEVEWEVPPAKTP